MVKLQKLNLTGGFKADWRMSSYKLIGSSLGLVL